MAYVVNHPLRNQTYRLLPDGSVRVDDLDAGTTGTFTRFGRPLSGELRFADLHLLSWVGGRAQHDAQRRQSADFAALTPGLDLEPMNLRA